MWKKALLWLVVFSLLTGFSAFAQSTEHLTWTVEELAERFAFEKRYDDLPVYTPQTPQAGVAIYVNRALSEHTKGGAERSLAVRNHIVEQMDGVLRLTDNPDEASILLCYEEDHPSKGEYTAVGTSGRTIEVYAGSAYLRMISLTGEGARSKRISATNRPNDTITTSASSAYYSSIPALEKSDEMDTFLSDLRALCALRLDHVCIGDEIFFPEVKSLVLSDESGSKYKSSLDIAPMAKLTDLEEVTLWNYTLRDISALASLPKLKKLVLHNGKIEDISPLSGLVSLQELVLVGNPIDDVSALSDLTALTILDLCANNLVDISPLSGLVSLRKLDLSFSKVADLTPLANLTALVDLSLACNLTTDITPLSSLAQLEKLDLQTNKIVDLAPLSGLVRLRSLSLRNNQITDLTPLSDLTELRSLDLGYNDQIKDILPLSGLSNLETISFSKSGIPRKQIDKLRKKLPNCSIPYGD